MRIGGDVVVRSPTLRGSVAAWQRGSVAAWQRGSVAAWQRGSVAAWQRWQTARRCQIVGPRNAGRLMRPLRVARLSPQEEPHFDAAL
jgi:hypothetical protein